MTKTESFQEFLKLPRSTGECDEGPEVVMRRTLLTVRYDVELDAGRAWTTLRFAGAVALRITPEPAVAAMAAMAYSKVGIINNSTWLASFVGPHGDGSLAADLKHFAVFFDHYGTVETIARSCEVE